jgi:hypothetical protein
MFIHVKSAPLLKDTGRAKEKSGGITEELLAVTPCT